MSELEAALVLAPAESSSCSGRCPSRMRIVENQRELPRKQQRHDHVVRHGFAVGVGHRQQSPMQTWWFFTDREDALAFGALARKSIGASGYGVYPAAQEVKYSDETNADVWALYVSDRSIDRGRVTV